MAAASSCVRPEADVSCMTPAGSGLRGLRDAGWNRCSGRKASPGSTRSSSPMPMPTTSMPCPICWPGFAWDGSSCPKAFWRVRPPVWPRCEGGRRPGVCRSARFVQVIHSRSIRSAACGCCIRGRPLQRPIPVVTTTNQASCSPWKQRAAGCSSPATSKGSRSHGSCSRGPGLATCSWRLITAAARRCRPLWRRPPRRTGCSSVEWADAAGPRFGRPTALHRAVTRTC